MFYGKGKCWSRSCSKLPRAVESLKVLFLDTLYIFIINIILAVCLARINVLLYDPPIRKSNCDALVVQTHLETFGIKHTEHMQDFQGGFTGRIDYQVAQVECWVDGSPGGWIAIIQEPFHQTRRWGGIQSAYIYMSSSTKGFNLHGILKPQNSIQL